MSFSLEQLVDMPHVFTRKKCVSEIECNLEELKARSSALAQKKLDAERYLRISDDDAAQYAELALSMEEAASLLKQKKKDCPCISTSPSKGRRLFTNFRI